MKDGDLSNVVAPKLIIVFEGGVGYLPENKLKEFLKYQAKNDWGKAIRCFDLNNTILDRILYLAWKKNFNISIVTWFPEEAAEQIEELMIRLSIPVRSVFSSKPADLARLLPYNPDILTVYDPVPEHVLTFGSKGVVLTHPSQLGG